MQKNIDFACFVCGHFYSRSHCFNFRRAAIYDCHVAAFTGNY